MKMGMMLRNGCLIATCAIAIVSCGDKREAAPAQGIAPSPEGQVQPTAPMTGQPVASPTGTVTPVATQAQPSPQAVQPVAPAPAPQPIPGMVYIPPGRFIAGTPPGTAPRCPHEEMPGQAVDLGGFYIDQFPYPAAGSPPTVNLSFAAAKQVCESQRKRLCTELEWERACKGRDNSVFPYGNVWDPSICGVKTKSDALPALGTLPRCMTEEGVWDMNGYAWEWTDSQWGIPGAGQADPVLRGGHKRYGKIANRCANRTHKSADTTSNRIGVRCCFGARNTAVSSIALTPSATFESIQLPVEDWKRLKTDPGNLAIIDDYREVRRLEQRADPAAIFGRNTGDYVFSRLAGDSILWHPVANTDLFVMNATYSKHRKRPNSQGGALLIFAEKDLSGVMRFIALFDRPDLGGEQPLFYTNPTPDGDLHILLAWRGRQGHIAIVARTSYNCGAIRLKPKRWMSLTGGTPPVPEEVPNLKPIYTPGLGT